MAVDDPGFAPHDAFRRSEVGRFAVAGGLSGGMDERVDGHCRDHFRIRVGMSPPTSRIAIAESKQIPAVPKLQRFRAESALPACQVSEENLSRHVFGNDMRRLHELAFTRPTEGKRRWVYPCGTPRRHRH